MAECLFQVREFLNKLEELVGKMSYENDPVKAQKPALQKRADALLKDLLKKYVILRDGLFLTTDVWGNFECIHLLFFFSDKVHLWSRISRPCLREKAPWFCEQMSSSLLKQGQCWTSLKLSSYIVIVRSHWFILRAIIIGVSGTSKKLNL